MNRFARLLMRQYVPLKRERNQRKSDSLNFPLSFISPSIHIFIHSFFLMDFFPSRLTFPYLILAYLEWLIPLEQKPFCTKILVQFKKLHALELEVFALPRFFFVVQNRCVMQLVVGYLVPLLKAWFASTLAHLILFYCVSSLLPPAPALVCLHEQPSPLPLMCGQLGSSCSLF